MLNHESGRGALFPVWDGTAAIVSEVLASADRAA